ncbi:hypothetical protein DY000_02047016 [Brassica cretica]|uniref:Uncharacterized protein n=1 Tax=Brassica cretica TaxID=69181 RepID=A0ABQ7EY76_BRACR|nr:hypothetical protein DY000_02047016 [Brassica cretica]
MSLRRSDPTRVTLPASDRRYACSSCERVKDSASLIPCDFVDDFTATTREREPACLNPRQDVTTRSSCERVKDSASLIPRDFVDDFTSITRVREPACLNPRQDIERLHSRMRGCDSLRDPTRVGALRCFMSSGLVNPHGTTRVETSHREISLLQGKSLKLAPQDVFALTSPWFTIHSSSRNLHLDLFILTYTSLL